MLKANKRSGRWYSRRRGFATARKKAYDRDGDVCRVSGEPLWIIVGHRREYFRAADHLYPERFCRRFFPGADPHVLENLVTVRPTVHAQKTAAEKYLYAGNWHSFWGAVLPLGYTREMFATAALALSKSAAERKVSNTRSQAPIQRGAADS